MDLSGTQQASEAPTGRGCSYHKPRNRDRIRLPNELEHFAAVLRILDIDDDHIKGNGFTTQARRIGWIGGCDDDAPQLPQLLC
jgi:hypothetical protein